MEILDPDRVRAKKQVCKSSEAVSTGATERAVEGLYVAVYGYGLQAAESALPSRVRDLVGCMVGVISFGFVRVGCWCLGNETGYMGI